MEREVIVVGAGPAGATAAMALAQDGRDVMLIDRQEFPRDKICGDAVPSGAIEIMQHYGMKDKIDAAVSRGEFYPVDQMRLVSPRGLSFDADFLDTEIQSYVAPRIYFDATLQQHAVDSGADFQKGQVQEPIIENGNVVGVRAKLNGQVKDIRSRMVIAADGVSSVIARKLRPDKHPEVHRAVALRAYIENIDELPHKVEFYLYKQILPGYAWVFPTGDGSANIGLGMRVDKFKNLKGDLKKMLDDFLAIPDIKARLRPDWKLEGVKTWPLNFGSQEKIPRAYNGAMLIGDAGGFINPLTGGGIHNGILSAKLAAELTHKVLDEGDTSRERLLEYERQCDAEMWEGMKRSYMMQKWLMRFPLAIDFLAWRMRGSSAFAKTFLEKL